MRPAYFLQAHDDELLYSVIARYGRHVGIASRAALSAILFDTRHVLASVDLPCRMARLSSKVRMMEGMEPDRLVDEHTLFPYHAAFQPAHKRDLARAAMIGDGHSRHFHIGAAGLRTRASTRLRFCPECLADMVRVYREAYWRRAHQLPGVLVCPDHGCLLLECAVDPSSTRARTYVAATAATCPQDAAPVVSVRSLVTLERLREVARASRALLSSTTTQDNVDTIGTYRGRLSRLGLLRSEHKVDVAAFERAFSDFFGDALDHLPMPSSSQSRMGWASEMLRVKQSPSSPLAHLLLRCFLDSAAPLEGDLGMGPWKCINPLAAHCGERVITHVERRSHGGNVTGTFVCSCGYAFRRRFEGGVAVGPPTFKRYGPTLEPVLRRLVSQGKSQRTVAKAIGLDVKTMNRQALALGMSLPWQFQESYAVASGASRLDGSHDPQVHAADAPLRRRVKGGTTFDWAGVDAEVAARLPAIAVEIEAAAPPIRVTATELERRLGRKAWLRSRKDLLPKANACIDTLTESVQAFQERRIRTCVRAMSDTNQRLVPWRVMRSVGLSGAHLPRIAAAISEIGGSLDSTSSRSGVRATLGSIS